MTNTIFKTKEQYHQFHAAWISAVNNKKAKSYIRGCYEWNSATNSMSEGKTAKQKISGWIKAEHHLFYNILRGKPIDNGFTPVLNKNKLKNGIYINHSIYHGLQHLILLQRAAKIIISGKETWHTVFIIDFFEPLNKTITLSMLASIEIPKIEPLYVTYGKSKHIVKKVIDGDFKPTNFKQIYDAIDML